MLRPWLLAALFLIVALAGCASGGNKAQNSGLPPTDFNALDLQSSDTTGIIRGLVVDTAIKPVANVSIALLAGSNANGTTKTNAQGVFGFSSVPPGTYFLRANKTGFIEVQQSVDVVAGVKEPPVAKIQLQVDPKTLPFYEVHHLDGFIQCSVRPMILAEQCGVTSADVANEEDTFSGHPLYIQSEMHWTSTQPLGDEMSLAIRCLPGASDPAKRCENGQLTVVRAEGKSPQIARINQTEIDNWSLSSTGNPLDISLFVFGREDLDFYNETQVDGYYKTVTGKDCPTWPILFDPSTCIRSTGPGLIVNQKVDVYTHIFYGYQPPDDWTFDQGDPPAPPTL